MFHNSRKFILKAVKQNGYALRNAGSDLKSDREIVLAAVQNDGFAICYAGGMR